jgi:hypothetical protein
LLAALISLQANAETIDQRHPGYQMAMEEYARAQVALNKAIEHLKRAEASYPLKMIDTIKMYGQIAPVNNALTLILRPEEERLKAQQLTPDSIFFNPISLSEATK